MKQHHFTEVEMKRYHLLQEVQNGHLTLAQAASLMGVSYRHAIRLKQRFLQQGCKGSNDGNLHNHHTRKSPRSFKQTILQLRQSIYYDFNLRHFQEKLALHHHIDLAYETLRQLLIPSGLASTPTQAQGVSASAKNALRRNAGADGLLPAPLVARSAHHVVVGGND
jgi:hypothetical protein